MSFDKAALLDAINRVATHLETLGQFEQVLLHEPKAPIGVGLVAAVWAQKVEPITSSGLSATSGRVVLFIRVYTNFVQKPEDQIDLAVVSAVADVMNAMTGDFNFGATLRMIDLLGAYGVGMEAQAGYVEIGKQIHRVMTITLPLVFNDMFIQAP